MALWSCGFEMGDTDYYLEAGWKMSGGTAGIVTDADKVHTTLSGNGGSRSMQIEDGTVSPYFSFSTARWFHMWFHPNASFNGMEIRFHRRNTGNNGGAQVSVEFYNSGLVEIWRGSAAPGGTWLAAGSYNPKVDHWIAIETIIDNSAGAVTVYVDGAIAVQVSGVDTQTQTDAWWDQFSFQNGNQYCCVDDIIITDASEGRLAEHVLPGLMPNADDVTALTPSTGTLNYALVDEVPQVTTDYNEATATLQQDTYDLENLAWTPDSIHCVTGWAYALRSGAITDAKLVAKSGGTDYYSSTIALPADGQYGVITNIWNDDPDTASAWTASGVNALKGGIQFI